MNAANEKRLARLLLSLNHRLAPTVFLVCSNTGTQRARLMEAITAGSPQYQHITIDLSPQEVYSLRDAIARFVPADVRNSKPLEYIVHFTGLSTSLWQTKDGKLEHTRLIDELNYERERLFHDYPFISFLWETSSFYKEIFFKAGDLMSWLVDRYEFEHDGEEEAPVDEIPEKEPMPHRGADLKRLAQIERLESLLQRLNENAANTQKYLREKTDTLLALGHECTHGYEWNKAEHYLMQAQKLIDLNYRETDREGNVLFYLAYLFSEMGKHEEALEYYGLSLQVAIALNDAANIDVNYHQIGIEYAFFQKWDKALASYNLALEWNKKLGSENQFTAGFTYHQIGMAYESQEKWEEALNNYRLAIEWKLKTGQEYSLGSSYHQIGNVYLSQNRWSGALYNFDLAIKLDKKSGQEFGLGSTYHQIGHIHEQQKNYTEALRYYRLSVESDEAFRNPNALVTKATIARIAELIQHLALKPKLKNQNPSKRKKK